MKNRTKQDKLFLNETSMIDGAKQTTGKPAGTADKQPFCIHNHQKHAVGSVIKNRDGSETVCTEDSSWENRDQ